MSSNSKNLNKSFFKKFLLNPKVRSLVGYARYGYYTKVQNRLKTIQSEDGYEVTVSHNLKGLNDHTNLRMDKLIRPLSVIETLNPDSQILVIGPRTESDLLHLIGYGFTQIRGLDLISYSPWIDIGDMHAMPYQVNTWDAIVLGWCISYSKNPKKVAEEVIRVSKNGAIVAIGVEYSVLSAEEEKNLGGYVIGANDKRVNSTDDILNLFEGHVAHVFFSHDAPLKQSHSGTSINPNVSAVAAIFSIKK